MGAEGLIQYLTIAKQIFYQPALVPFPGLYILRLFIEF